MSDSYDAILRTCVHLPQSSNLKMPVGLGAQDIHASGCQGSLAFFFTAGLKEPFGVRDPPPSIVLSFHIKFSTYPKMPLGKTHTESLMNLVALLQL